MLEILEDAARAGGEVLKKYFRQEISIAHKSSPRDLVTIADTESQKVVKKVLFEKSQKKGIVGDSIGFIGEEGLFEEGTHLFIIDPLDGTTNFASGIPYFCITLAFARNGVVEAGVIYDPITDIMFTAERGKGSYVKGKDGSERLSVKQIPLIDCVIDTHISSNFTYAKRLLDIYHAMHSQVRKFRSFGSIALSLAHFADNRFGAVLNFHAFIWDIAAGFLIVSEAGGEMTDASGNPIELNFNDPSHNYSVIASHPANIGAIQSFVK